MRSVESIFNSYDTDKNSSFHNYSRQYESLLGPYRSLDDTAILEIGIYTGESLKAMRDVFHKSRCIVGMDITPSCKQYEDSGKNIFIEIGDASSAVFVNYVNNKFKTSCGKGFDVILDDGSHINREVIQTFELLFPLLNDGGVYIVEDTVCYKNAYTIDSSYPDHLSYFFQYARYLNQWRYDSPDGVRDNCTDPFKIAKKTENVFEYSVDKIEYGSSYIAIHKKIKPHWIPV